MLAVGQVTTGVLTESEGGFVITHDPLNDVHGMAPLQFSRSSRLRLVDRLEMRMLYEVVRSKLVLKTAQQYLPVSEKASNQVQQLVLELCNMGQFRQALALALQCDAYRKRQDRAANRSAADVDFEVSGDLCFFRDIAVVCFAREVALAEEAVRASVCGGILCPTLSTTAYALDNYFHGRTKSFCEIISDEERSDCTTHMVVVVRQQLLDALLENDFNNSDLRLVYQDGRSSIHAMALRAFMTVSRNVPLPRRLLGELAGMDVRGQLQQCFNTWTTSNVASLLRILSEFHKFDEACHYACNVLGSTSCETDRKATCGTWIPYEAIDLLLVTMRDWLKHDDRYLKRLEGALEMHFSRLLRDYC